jgi:hypothetical protein
MDGPLNIVHAPWLLRQAVHLIVGLEMVLTSSEFHFTVCSRIQWFKIREVLVVGGEGRRLQRRDLRGGGSLGRCAITKEGIWLSTEWEDPYRAFLPPCAPTACPAPDTVSTHRSWQRVGPLCSER